MPRNKIFTVYDMMEDKGVFSSNPANADSRDKEGQSLYNGPVQYPKMLYHPLGEQKIIEPERQEMGPFGPVRIPAKYEMISVVAKSEAEEAKLVSEGWHTHPARALKAAGKDAPATSSADHINHLESELKRLQDQLAAATSEKVVASPSPTGAPLTPNTFGAPKKIEVLA